MKLLSKCFFYNLLIIVGLSSCTTSNSPKTSNTSPKVINTAPKALKNTIISHYIDHGNGTVTDTKTHLMWKKCTEGHKGTGCSGYFSLWGHYEKGYYGDPKWVKTDKKCHKYFPNGRCQHDNSEWMTYIAGIEQQMNLKIITSQAIETGDSLLRKSCQV